MGYLTIDETRCRKDGICADNCPGGIIRLRGKNRLPEIPRALEKGCIACGHCVAICPHGALTHSLLPLEECPAIDPANAISEKQAEQFLRTRRSIRSFKDRPVERAKIERLIEMARYAPTAGNSQMVAWHVVTDKGCIRQVADLTAAYMRRAVDTRPKESLPVYYRAIVSAYEGGLDAILRDAPVLLVASTPAMLSNGTVDLTLALSYLELMAPVLGLGTCWAGLVYSAMEDGPEVKALLGIPEDHTFFYPMMLGYPKYKYYRLPNRKAPDIAWK